jgi:hypothetical protein
MTDAKLLTFYEFVKIDDLIKSQKRTFSVISAKAGIQEKQGLLDPGLRRGDDSEDLLRERQTLEFSHE